MSFVTRELCNHIRHAAGNGASGDFNSVAECARNGIHTSAGNSLNAVASNPSGMSGCDDRLIGVETRFNPGRAVLIRAVGGAYRRHNDSAAATTARGRCAGRVLLNRRFRVHQTRVNDEHRRAHSRYA
jgi:hypothetical protein